jgi:hypothetical protein
VVHKRPLFEAAPFSESTTGFDPRWFGARISRREWHFHRQLFQRYRIVLALGQFSQIVADIQDGRARLVNARGKRGDIYVMRISKTGGKVYILAIGGVPVTAWPLESAKRLVKNAASSQRGSL